MVMLDPSSLTKVPPLIMRPVVCRYVELDRHIEGNFVVHLNADLGRLDDK